MKMLVSVRSVEEALLAARHGADFIDLKEPGAGALGGLPLATIRAIVAALREAGSVLPVSATIGDWPPTARAAILERVAQVAACGVTFVKVGIERGEGARALIDALAASGAALVPVFIADRGVDAGLVRHAAALGFGGLMLDTADKRAGSLFDAMATHELQAFVQSARSHGAMTGLAGALRLSHAEALRALAPDFAGFRTAVCAADERSAALDVQRLRGLRAALRPDAVRAEPVENRS